MKKRWMSAVAVSWIVFPLFAWAQSSSEESWHLDTGRIIGGSSQESGVRLMDPVILDWDGDGIDDVVFGAPAAAPNGVSNAGSLYVLAGKRDRTFSGTLDMTYWDSFDWRFDGHTPNGQLGMQLYVGDFNGDGKKDLAVAEPGANGAVYLFYGGKKRDRGIYDAASQGAADVTFFSSEPGSWLGLSGCVGDFNRDGIDDLALASFSKNSTFGTLVSQMTVVTMRSQWDKPRYDLGSKLNGKTVLSRSISGSARVVHSCTAGDFNDDGVPDIALGMPMDSVQKQKAAGSVTVIYHPSKYSGTTIDLSVLDPKHGIRIFGTQTNAQFGTSLAAGDFTGDGRDDLAVSSPNFLSKGPENEGLVTILDGNHFPTESTEIPQEGVIRLVGKGGQFGHRVQSVDVNGDARADLVVSAPGAGQLQDGALSIWLGGPHFAEMTAQSARADVEILGGDFMGFGVGAAFGDWNGDGKKDAVIRTTADPMQRAATGAYAVLGNVAEMPATSTIHDNFLTIVAPSRGGALSVSPRRVSLHGKTYTAWFSPQGLGNRSVICLVETTRGTQDDIAVSSTQSCDLQIVGPENAPIADFALNASPTLKPQLTVSIPTIPLKNATGVVAVMALPEELPNPLVLNLNEKTLGTQAQTFVLSGEDASNLGIHVEWSDLDQDGYEDLIIGAPGRTIDADESGSVFIVKGKLDRRPGFYELTGSDVIEYDGFLDERLGDAWQIVDFDGDGKKDLLLHAQRAAHTAGSNYASLYVVYSAGYRQPKVYNVRTPDVGAMQIIAAQPQTQLTIIPQTVDLNGDGLDDVILMSTNYRAGLQKEGAIYGLFASPDHKSGQLDLSKSSHAGFFYTPARNERIIDGRFVRREGRLQFYVATADATTGTTTTLDALVTSDRDAFVGSYIQGQLMRVRPQARLKKVTRFSVFADEARQNDEVWLIFPHDGVTMSGQGTAQKVRPD